MGNPKTIKLLIKHGADVERKNKQGINVLHLAAQGDKAFSLAFFKTNHKMAINERDSEMSTPLHWACFSGSEIAIYYLLAWAN